MRLLLLGSFCALALRADPLADVLAQMDRNAASFRAASAQITQVAHNAAVDVDTTHSGTLLLRRPSPRDLRLLIDFKGPDAEMVSLQGTTAQVYYPKAKTVQEYQVGKNRELFDQFFLLGFGSSGKDLVSNYDITVKGSENIADAATLRLEMIPKSKEVRAHLTKVELWVVTSSGYPAQQRLYQPSGDYTTLSYSGIKINPAIPDSALKLKLPKGVQVVQPQK